MHGWQALNKLSKIETETLFPGPQRASWFLDGYFLRERLYCADETQECPLGSKGDMRPATDFGFTSKIGPTLLQHRL